MKKEDLERFNKILGISAAYSMFPDECMRMELDAYMKEEEKRYKENYDKIQFGETETKQQVHRSEADWKGEAETNPKVKNPSMEFISKGMDDIRAGKNPNSAVWRTLPYIPDVKMSCDLLKTENSSYTLKEKEEQMANTTIQWENPSSTLYFKDLAVGEHFKIATEYSKGAVYRKVLLSKNLGLSANAYLKGDFGQLEVQVAEIFTPTESPVERVEVGITIKALKPNIY